MPTLQENEIRILNSVTKEIEYRFIEPGLARYSDKGTVLIRKEALDKFAQSLVGKPIFNEMHRETSDSDFKNGIADGVVTSVWFDSADGWYHCKGLIWDRDTLRNCSRGFACSCAYNVKDWSHKSGLHNNVPFDDEVLNGEYTHLAIVADPRYEGATKVSVLQNSKGGSMKLKFWEKDKKDTDAPSEIELANALVKVGEKEMPFEKVMELAQVELTRQADELANAKKILGDDQVVEIGGKKMTVRDAKALAEVGLKNASESEYKEAHKDGKHDEKDMENCPMCNTRKNEKEEADKKREDDKERKNRSDANLSFERLDALNNKRGEGKEKIKGEAGNVAYLDRPDAFAVGREKFGSKKPEGKN